MGWSFEIKNLYLKDFYNRKIIINEIEAGLSGNKIERSDYVMKNNTDASIVVELEIDDTDSCAVLFLENPSSTS